MLVSNRRYTSDFNKLLRVTIYMINAINILFNLGSLIYEVYGKIEENKNIDCFPESKFSP